MPGGGVPSSTERSEPRTERGGSTDVVREAVELFRLEREFAAADSDEKRYNILTEILIRELAQALVVPEPDTVKTSEHHQKWLDDTKEIEAIADSFESMDVPIPPTPQFKPLMAEYPKVRYEVKFPGSAPLSYFAREELLPGMQFLMQSERQRGFHAATVRLKSARLKVRTFLARYGVWKFRSAFSTRAEVYSEDDADAEMSHSLDIARGSPAVAASEDDDLTEEEEPYEDEGSADGLEGPGGP